MIDKNDTVGDHMNPNTVVVVVTFVSWRHIAIPSYGHQDNVVITVVVVNMDELSY